MERYKRVIVTIEREYQIPMSRSLGKSIKDVIKRWFKDCPIWSAHATRDSCKVGHSDKVVKVKVESAENGNS